MNLAIFDLDNTLLNGDSDHAWGEFLSDHGLVNPEAYRETNDQFYQDYLRGELDIIAYQTFCLKIIKNRPLKEILSWRQEFISSKITPMLLTKARQLIKKHKTAGEQLIIITATNRFITEPIAKLYDIDLLIATEPELNGELYTGNVIGTPCYREGKITRLEEWMNQNKATLDGSYFYSDSHNDIPLLQIVENPVAVDPDESLREHAVENNWPIISLRD